MLLVLKYTLITKSIRQNRLAADLGWDGAKLSRIINEFTKPSPTERAPLAQYLGMREDVLFANEAIGQEAGRLGAALLPEFDGRNWTEQR